MLADRRYDAAIPLLEGSQAEALSRLGPLHPVTLQRTALLVQALEAGGHSQRVVDVYRRALAAATAREGEARALRTQLAVSLAMAYLERGWLADANALAARIQQSLDNDRIVDPALRADVLALRAGISHRRGDGSAAEADYLRAIELADEFPELRQSGRLASYSQALAVLYLDMGRGADADLLFARSRSAVPAEGYRGAVDRLLLENGSALRLRSLGQFEQAAQRFSELYQDATREIGALHPVTLMLQNNLAFTRDLQRRQTEALPLYREVYRGRRQALGEDHPHTLTSANNLAWALSRTGDYEGAEALFETALAVAERGLGPDNGISYALRTNALLNLLDQPNPDMSVLRRNTMSLAASIERARAASTAAVRDLATDAQSRSDMAASSELLVAALWRLSQDPGSGSRETYDLGFRAMQLAMADSSTRAIGEMVSRNAAETGPAALRTLLAERARLSLAWQQADTELTNALRDPAAGAAVPGDAAARRERAVADVQRLNGAIRQQFPAYAAALTGEPISEAEAQALLAPDEALVVILPTDRGTYVYVIRNFATLWVGHPISRELLEGAVGVLRQDLEAHATTGGSSFPTELAHDLYQALLGRAEAGLSGVRHLYVVGSGPLSRLPLGVLVRTAPNNTGAASSLRGVDWLANSYSISQLPSVQALRQLRQSDRGRNRFTTMVGIGDPAPHGDWTANLPALLDGTRLLPQATAMARRRWLERNARARALPRLPASSIELQEIRRVAALEGATILTGDRATEGALNALPLDRADLLVFSTHTLFDGAASADGGALVLSTPPMPPRDERDDGFLSARDVLQLRLNADLVILSACNTAGTGSDSEAGVNSLTQAFLYAGAHNVIASHWRVRDDIAARITISMIERLRSDQLLTVPQALRDAQRLIREDPDRPGDAHPGVWATLTFIGDGARRPAPST